jgi:hypothetical protein
VHGVRIGTIVAITEWYVALRHPPPLDAKLTNIVRFCPKADLVHERVLIAASNQCSEFLRPRAERPTHLIPQRRSSVGDSCTNSTHTTFPITKGLFRSAPSPTSVVKSSAFLLNKSE